MMALHFNKRNLFFLSNIRLFSTVTQVNNEYTSTPKYPEILDLSWEKQNERKKGAVHEEIKNIKTVEEKQIKMNMPKYYGFNTYILKETEIPYNSLTLTQHVTRTHLINMNQLPEIYNSIKVNIEDVQTDIEESVLFEYDCYRRIHDIKEEQVEPTDLENIISSSISHQVNRCILKNLLSSHPHLNDVQIDFNSRIESFWYAGGIDPPVSVKEQRERQSWQKHLAETPANRALAYMGTADVALRAKKPLRPIIPYNECEKNEFHVPHWKYDPQTLGIKMERRHIANVPGFWPGDPHEFPILSYHGRAHLQNRQHYNDSMEQQEALHRQGILASFGWLNAQANFLGFNSFNDLTYPLCTQTIITNGKLWSFFCYQLNTIKYHDKYYEENPKCNICWATPELKLFETIENGKLIGFNKQILDILLKFYANLPEDRLGQSLKPYLGIECLIADYEDAEKRTWLEEEYKRLVSNRPRHKLDYEIYDWERIYKIQHETRFMEKRMRPFELGINPYDRRLDERLPRYVPRALRPHLPKYKGRYAKTFFP